MGIYVCASQLYQYKHDRTGSKSKLVNKLNSMVTFSEVIISWWLFYSSLHAFYLIILPNNRCIKSVQIRSFFRSAFGHSSPSEYNTDGPKQKRVPVNVKELERLKHSSTKMHNVTPFQLHRKMKSNMSGYS